MAPRLDGCWADGGITSCWPGGFFPCGYKPCLSGMYSTAGGGKKCLVKSSLLKTAHKESYSFGTDSDDAENSKCRV